MIKNCIACGKEFETKTTGKYCINCRYVRYGTKKEKKNVQKGGEENEKNI